MQLAFDVILVVFMTSTDLEASHMVNYDHIMPFSPSLYLSRFFLFPYFPFSTPPLLPLLISPSSPPPLVPVVCLRDPDFVEAKGKLYSTSVLGSLGETEPTVVGKLWEAAIMIVSKTEVCNKGAWLCVGVALWVWFSVICFCVVQS